MIKKIGRLQFKFQAIFIVACIASPCLFAQVKRPQIVWDTLITGHFTKDEVRTKIVYVPINVPEGITAFTMQASITDSTNNVLDIGLFDERGIGMGPVNGFRGWAGGVSSKLVTITRQDATPSYLAGSINKGIWNVMLVPTNIKIDGYDWRLKVSLERSVATVRNFIPKPARSFINNKQGWYRGDLHIHDVNSDGTYTQGELVDYSKAAGLDFIIPSDHNTNSANLTWGKYDDSSILILNGEEVTPFMENHWNAIGIKSNTWIEWRYDAASGLINQYQQQVKAAGGLSVINHPFYNNDSILDYRFPVEGFDAIEVWNGPWDVNDEYAVGWWNSLLEKGLRKTAIGASDSHKPEGPNKIAHPQTVVYAKGLNRAAIIDGIRTGTCYLAENSSISINLKVSVDKSKKSGNIGDTIQANQNDGLTITGKFAGIADSSIITIISDHGIEQVFKNMNSKSVISYKVLQKKIRYLRVEVRNANNSMQALSNPIWIQISK